MPLFILKKFGVFLMTLAVTSLIVFAVLELLPPHHYLKSLKRLAKTSKAPTVAHHAAKTPN